MSAGKIRCQGHRLRYFNAAVISVAVRVWMQSAQDRFPGVCLFSGVVPGCRVKRQ
jgi:hypothetical protein